MKAPVIVYSRGVCACPVCGILGHVGASCDECLRRAYRNALAMAQAEEVASRGLATVDVWIMARERRAGLLAGVSGVDVIRDVLPGARFEMPEVGR